MGRESERDYQASLLISKRSVFSTPLAQTRQQFELYHQRARMCVCVCVCVRPHTDTRATRGCKSIEGRNLSLILSSQAHSLSSRYGLPDLLENSQKHCAPVGGQSVWECPRPETHRPRRSVTRNVFSYTLIPSFLLSPHLI